LIKFLGFKAKAFRPKINNIMYYPARRPPSAARPVTLASALEYSPDISKEAFLKASRVGER